MRGDYLREAPVAWQKRKLIALITGGKLVRKILEHLAHRSKIVPESRKARRQRTEAGSRPQMRASASR